jgi:hypothetical protein
MDLRFDDNFDITELARDLFRFIERRRDFTSCRCDIEPLQQLLGLIFVNVHLQEAAFPTSAAIDFRESGIACRMQISKDFSFPNWLATLKTRRIRWRA